MYLQLLFNDVGLYLNVAVGEFLFIGNPGLLLCCGVSQKRADPSE